MPVRMSPEPPLAMEGFPVVLTATVPSGVRNEGAPALENQSDAVPGGEGAREIEAVCLDFFGGDAKKRTHLAGVRCEDDDAFAALASLL